jgi:hypothetical protein
MKASELRIGNLVYIETNSSLDPLREVTGDHLKQSEDGDTIIEPIPLTEEWLEKFAWYSQRDGNYVFDANNYYSIAPDGSLYFNDAYTSTDIQYVHQLQNLYFALTGTELEIN